MSSASRSAIAATAVVLVAAGAVSSAVALAKAEASAKVEQDVRGVQRGRRPAPAMFLVDLSNEAYKFGVNYVIYAMTH